MIKIINVILTLILMIGFAPIFAETYESINPSSFCGTWITNSSRSELHITSIGSYFEISMKDKSKYNRTINISDVYWDGQSLSFTSYCVENNWTVNHKLSLRKKCSKNICLLVLMDNFDGDPDDSSMIWEKK